MLFYVYHRDTAAMAASLSRVLCVCEQDAFEEEIYFHSLLGCVVSKAYTAPHSSQYCHTSKEQVCEWCAYVQVALVAHTIEAEAKIILCGS